MSYRSPYLFFRGRIQSTSLFYAQGLDQSKDRKIIVQDFTADQLVGLLRAIDQSDQLLVAWISSTAMLSARQQSWGQLGVRLFRTSVTSGARDLGVRILRANHQRSRGLPLVVIFFVRESPTDSPTSGAGDSFDGQITSRDAKNFTNIRSNLQHTSDHAPALVGFLRY